MDKKARILIVDDEIKNVELLEAILQVGPYELLKAENGTQALAILAKDEVDLVLLDVMMPVIDGFEVLRRIREHEKTRGIPVILVTALYEVAVRIKGIEAGCDEFITKPFDLQEVAARVKTALKLNDYRTQVPGMKALYIWLPVVGIIGLAFSGYLYSGLIGLTFAVVAYPIYRRLRGWVHGSHRRGLRMGQARNLAAFLTEFIVMAAVILGLFLPSMVLYKNRTLLVTHCLTFYGQSMDWSKAQISVLENRLSVNGLIMADGKGIIGAATTPLSGLKQVLFDPTSMLPLAVRTVTGLAVASVHLMVLLLIMHVSLLHGPDFWEHILEHTPSRWLVTLQRLGQRAKEVLKATYVVQGVTALVSFVTAIPVFWIILGPPNFFLAAVLCGLFQLIPFLGSGFFLLGLVAYFFLQGQTVRAWECLFLAFPLVAGVADLVVRPYLARSWGRISSVTMLIGFVAGMEAFGLAGFVLGPLFLELFVCFTAIMLYGPAYKESYLYPARTGLEKVD